MIPLPDGTFRYSPTDLVAYLEGDFAAWCDRMAAERRRAGGAGSAELEWASPDDDDPELALAIELGNRHEQRWLQRFRERYPTILELDRADPEGPARTLAAMGQGIPAIYQAHLISDGWGGYPDFLIRCTASDHTCDPRGWHYTPLDTKLARSAKPGFLLQLCAYADLLEDIDGFRPSEIRFIRPPEPRREHHPRPGAPAPGSRHCHIDRAGRLRRPPPDSQGVGDRLRPPAAPGPPPAPLAGSPAAPLAA